MRRLLELPGGFDFYQRVIGAPASKRVFVQEIVRPQGGDAVLDLGCGTGALHSYIPAGASYVGVDLDQGYVDAARKRYGDEAEFVRADITEYRPERTFDVVMAYGVLHHLDDGQVLAMLGHARSALTDSGRFVAAEPALESTTRGFEAFLKRHDRGRFIRSHEGYAGLAGQVFERATARLVPKTYRIPYTLAILECPVA